MITKEISASLDKQFHLAVLSIELVLQGLHEFSHFRRTMLVYDLAKLFKLISNILPTFVIVF